MNFRRFRQAYNVRVINNKNVKNQNYFRAGNARMTITTVVSLRLYQLNVMRLKSLNRKITLKIKEK